MAVTPLMEQMAISVLRGDEAAALALADELCERRKGGERQIPPVKTLNVPVDRLRVVLRTYPELGGDVSVDAVEVEQAVQCWLRHGGPLILTGMTVELYELPPVIGDYGEPVDLVDDPSDTSGEPEEEASPSNPYDYSPLANDPNLEADSECRRIWGILRGARKDYEVSRLRSHGKAHGGCCRQWSETGKCDCLSVAHRDTF